MNIRTVAALLSMALLIGLTACSTTSEAETDESAQTEQQADDHAAHHPDDQQPDAEEAEDSEQMMEQMCPMQVEGTTRELVELDDAVAMEFTTTGDVAELRRRVEEMAQMHEGMHGEDGQMHHGGQNHEHDDDSSSRPGQMHDEMSEEKRQRHQQMMQMMSDVTVETEEIEDGMRIKFIPDDDAQVDELYEMMQQHTERMEQEGRCPMMHMMDDEPGDEPDDEPTEERDE